MDLALSVCGTDFPRKRPFLELSSDRARSATARCVHVGINSSSIVCKGVQFLNFLLYSPASTDCILTRR